MSNWEILSERENDFMWDKVVKELRFDPFPNKFLFQKTFHVSKPYKKFNISLIFRCKEKWDIFMREMETNALNAFQDCTSENERIYALNWQHQGYTFNPRLEMERNEFDEWLIPLIPDGDYCLFLQKDLEWGILGIPFKNEIIVFGEKFTNSLHVPNFCKEV